MIWGEITSVATCKVDIFAPGFFYGLWIHRRKFVGVIKKHDIPQYMGAVIRIHIYLVVCIYIIYIHDCTYIPVLYIGVHEMSALQARMILRCFAIFPKMSREAMVNGGINLDSIPSRFLERARQM